MRKILLIILIAATTLTVAKVKKDAKAAPVAPTMTNDSIIKMLNMGLSSESIIKAIEDDTVRDIRFDLTYMRQLKQAGADAPLITYIQDMYKQDNTYDGFYWWNTGDKPVRLKPTDYKKKKDGFSVGKLAWKTMTGQGVGYVAGQVAKSATKKKYGEPPMLSTPKDFEKLYMEGKVSQNVVLTYEPVFRLYLPKNDIENFDKSDESKWYKSSMVDVMTADEFQLILLDQDGKKRVFDSGCEWEGGSFEGKKKKHKYVIDCYVEQYNNNTFEIAPCKPLKPGEYVFFWKNGISTPAFMYHVFGFDFTVPKMKKK